eukprot:TRINITY_DN106391_c0_g1_i1.p1 TRINITY_DN106391_c0_g1~~TRINITY_DN106391_c0_g1_i1.p1  ORF type:complete len:584 (-),score=97.25 TRINITY_DN106391_c0_g1_i1:83-1834(-)
MNVVGEHSMDAHAAEKSLSEMELSASGTDPDRSVSETQQLTSGQTWFQKLQFASSLVSPMAGGSVLLLCKDLYVLELAADAQLMGIAGTVLAVWAICCQILAGYALERVVLTRWFPWDSWGRRAPWFLTHVLAASIVAAAIYMPPSWDPIVLSIWYLVWGAALSWLLAVIFICFESSRAEIYPTKEERSEVEAVVKITSGIGAGLGILPQLVVSTGVTQISMLLAGVSLFVVGLISLVSVPVLRRARQDYNTELLTGNFFSEWWDLTRLDSFRCLCAYRFFDSTLNTLAINGTVYYLTFVSGKSGEERAFFALVTGGVAGFSALVTMPLWTTFFRKRRPNLNINKVCGLVTASGVLSPVLLLLGFVVPTPWEFMAYFAFQMASITGQTYWRANALCWVIDEDCQAAKGRRREAMFAGCISLVSGIGRALAAGLLLNALAWSGLKVSNCAIECSDRTGEAKALCREACELKKFEEQDPRVAFCIEVFYVAVIPSLQLVASLLVCMFPIHGERLNLLYARQEAIFKAVDASEIGAPQAGASTSQPGEANVEPTFDVKTDLMIPGRLAAESAQVVPASQDALEKDA